MAQGNTALIYSPDLDFNLPDFTSLGDAPGSGTSNVHAFDGARASRAFERFLDGNPGAQFTRVEPTPVLHSELAWALAVEHLNTLVAPRRGPARIAEIIGVPAAAGVALEVLDRILLAPMRLAVGGTLAATRFVLGEERRGQGAVAINLGGGYHHGHHDRGEGFCFYNDIALAAEVAEREFGVRRVLSVDVDAHQGNGTATMFAGRAGRAHLDLFNKDIWPGDSDALAATRWPVGLPSGTKGDAYLAALEASLDVALRDFEPELILYNAGTDSLDVDSLGNLSLTLADIRARDALVLNRAADRGVPLVAVPSGGYSDSSHIALAGLLEVATRPRTL